MWRPSRVEIALHTSHEQRTCAVALRDWDTEMTTFCESMLPAPNKMRSPLPPKVDEADETGGILSRSNFACWHDANSWAQLHHPNTHTLVPSWILTKAIHSLLRWYPFFLHIHYTTHTSPADFPMSSRFGFVYYMYEATRAKWWQSKFSLYSNEGDGKVSIISQHSKIYNNQHNVGV